MKMLFCDVCNAKITIIEGEEFNYTENADGPFCDRCWFFVQRIESLGDRIKDLETRALLDRKDRPSPYDCSVRRR
jgi:hypothetical protein